MTDYEKLANPSNIYRHILLEDDEEGSLVSLEQREEEESPYFLPERFTLSLPIRRPPTPTIEGHKQKTSYVMEPHPRGHKNLKTPIALVPSTLTNETQTKREHNNKPKDSLLHQNSIEEGIEMNESFSGGRNSYTSNFSGEWMCRLIPQQETKSKPRYSGGEDSQQLLPSRLSEECSSKTATCFNVKRPAKNHPHRDLQSSLTRRPWEIDQWHSQRMQQMEFEIAQIGLPKGSWAAGHQSQVGDIRETSNSSRRSVHTPATSASSQTPFEAFKEPVPFPFDGHPRTRTKSELSFTDLVGQMALRETSWESELSASAPKPRIVPAATPAKAKNAAIPRVVYVDAQPEKTREPKHQSPSNASKVPDRTKIKIDKVPLRKAKPPVIEVDVSMLSDNDNISQITNPNYVRKDCDRHFSFFVNKLPQSARTTGDVDKNAEYLNFM